jgi:predicted phage terminase large subunit-like protein
MILSKDQVLAELCRRSFYRFVKEFWHEVVSEDPVYNWHIKYLCDELQLLNSYVVRREPKPYDLIINVPPGTTKSTIVSQMYTPWVWTIDPSQRHISSSYSQTLSLGHSTKTRDIVLSDKYKRLFPEVKLKEDQSAKSDFWNTLGGERFTTSTGSAVTGVHAHQQLVDDPINPHQANSEVQRRDAEEHVLQTLSTRKVNKRMTPLVLVMQRVHESDPTGLLLVKQGKKIRHICLPATSDRNVVPPSLRDNYVNGLLDPIRLDRQALTEAKLDLGSYGYAGQYEQDPAPAEGGIFKKDSFKVIPWSQDYAGLTWNFVADTAYTSDDANDPSGIWCYTKYKNDFIVRHAQTFYLEFPELCRKIVSFAQLHGYTKKSVIEVEPKASGKSLVQTLKRNTQLNIKEGKPPAKDKIARANDSSPVVESGRILFIEGPWNQAAIDQLCTFPNAAHDEHVDCLTMMVGDTRPTKRGLKRRN